MSIASRTGKGVTLNNISKYYGGAAAVKNVSMDIAPGEFITLLGPSGSGKTTTMMAIAGFTDLTDGDVQIDGRRIDLLPPHKRGIGVVFQHLALFPHMSVSDNIAFSLRMRGANNAHVKEKVKRALDLVHMSTFGDRFPSQLSGGQQQRVALARAIIFDPPVLLLDEPLSALDRKLRESMQAELKNLQRQLGVTTIMVTHDQGEALAVSDRIAVMDGGEVIQIDTPARLYENPNSLFVADFIGQSTKLFGRVVGQDGERARIRTSGGCEVSGRMQSASAGAGVTVVMRPERLSLSKQHGAENSLPGYVRDVVYAGEAVTYSVQTSATEFMTVKVPNAKAHAQMSIDDEVVVVWSISDTMIFIED